MNKYLKNYYNAVEELTKEFCKKYFKGVYEYDVNDWIGGNIGGVIHINDYYFDFRDIKIALEYKPTKDELFDYYDCKDCIKFENYLKYFRGFSFKEIDKTLKKL